MSEGKKSIWHDLSTVVDDIMVNKNETEYLSNIEKMKNILNKLNIKDKEHKLMHIIYHYYTNFYKKTKNNKYPEILQLFVNKITNNYKNKISRELTSLFTCFCEHGELELVKLMINNPCVDRNDLSYWYTPIYAAATNGQINIVKYLLTYPDINVCYFNPRDFLDEINIVKDCDEKKIKNKKEMINLLLKNKKVKSTLTNSEYNELLLKYTY